MTAFLSVESSLTGRLWRGPDATLERTAEALAQDSRLPLPVARVLAARGVSAQEAPGYLDPKLRDLLPDPLSLRDMAKAAARIAEAALGRQRIAIFADYDVDGGASAALLIDWLRQQGHEATLYIPDRIDEGYGPNAPAMAALAEGHDLIICVDCGTLSHEALAAAAPSDRRERHRAMGGRGRKGYRRAGDGAGSEKTAGHAAGAFRHGQGWRGRHHLWAAFIYRG